LPKYNDTLLKHRCQVVNVAPPFAFDRGDKLDFRPIRRSTFQAALSNPSSLYTVLALAARDIAASRGLPDSFGVMKYRAVAIGLLNKGFQEHGLDPSDDDLVAVTLLASYEVRPPCL
jgi:hypothetical protein